MAGDKYEFVRIQRHSVAAGEVAFAIDEAANGGTAPIGSLLESPFRHGLRRTWQPDVDEAVCGLRSHCRGSWYGGPVLVRASAPGSGLRGRQRGSPPQPATRRGRATKANQRRRQQPSSACRVRRRPPSGDGCRSSGRVREATSAARVSLVTRMPPDFCHERQSETTAGSER